MNLSDSDTQDLYYICHNCRRRLPKVNWSYIHKEGNVFCSGDCSLSFEFGVNQRHTFLNHRKVRHKNKQEGKECQRVDETPKPTWVMKQNDKPKELEQTLDRSWENALFQLEYIQNTAELF